MHSSSGKLKDVLSLLKNPAWVCFVWFGLTAGAALLAVPAIFSAESASRPVSLDAARSVFEVLNRAEFVLLIVLLILVRVTGSSRQWWSLSMAIALIMIGQGAWLVPELSARTDMILGGNEPPASMAHAAYSISSLVKLAILFVMGLGLTPTRERRGS